MKKNKILSIIACAALTLLTAACSTDENKSEGTTDRKTMQFSFTNEDFGNEEALSRAGAPETKSQLIDLGDCEAEVSIESEPAVKSRAPMTQADGHYTVRAYQGGMLKAEMSGTFSGGAFIADAARTTMTLANGTYDFLAFNDAVTANGSNLTIAREKAATAMIGTATATINQYPEQTVLFTMKHVGCRLRTRILCQKHIPAGITATIGQTAANQVPASVEYDPITQNYTPTYGTITSGAFSLPASTEEEFTASDYGKDYSYTSIGDYQYFLPTTNTSKVALSFTGGTLFTESLSGQRIPSIHPSLILTPGKSYRITLKLKPSFIYLMSDGTTGPLKETTFKGGTKTPIAVVIDKATHIAMALKEADNGARPEWCKEPYWIIKTNTNMIWGQDIRERAQSGLDETWDASYSTGTIGVKATNPNFPAFNVAAAYNPGTYTGSPALKWFLPSYTDWLYTFAVLGFGDQEAAINRQRNYNWYGHLADLAFTQAGGTGISNKWYWVSSEITQYEGGLIFVNPTDLFWHSAEKNGNAFVHPFVKY